MARVEIIGNCTLYLGDCRDVLPGIVGDAVVTDPPYPDYHEAAFRADEFAPSLLALLPCKQFVFWSARAEFPLDYTAVHIWHKTGSEFASYERIFERNGGRSFAVFTGNPISNHTMARFARDEWHGHPTQKPVRLIRQLIERTSGVVIDPFMGSGTTGAASVNLGRPFVGVEIKEAYFDIACRRIEAAQPDMFLSVTSDAPQEQIDWAEMFEKSV